MQRFHAPAVRVQPVTRLATCDCNGAVAKDETALGAAGPLADTLRHAHDIVRYRGPQPCSDAHSCAADAPARGMSVPGRRRGRRALADPDAPHQHGADRGARGHPLRRPQHHRSARGPLPPRARRVHGRVPGGAARSCLAGGRHGAARPPGGRVQVSPLRARRLWVPGWRERQPGCARLGWAVRPGSDLSGSHSERAWPAQKCWGRRDAGRLAQDHAACTCGCGAGCCAGHPAKRFKCAHAGPGDVHGLRRRLSCMAAPCGQSTQTCSLHHALPASLVRRGAA
jgi:hypothetical protein